MRQLIPAVESGANPGCPVPHVSGGACLVQADRIPTGWSSELEAARLNKNKDVKGCFSFQSSGILVRASENDCY